MLRRCPRHLQKAVRVQQHQLYLAEQHHAARSRLHPAVAPLEQARGQPVFQFAQLLTKCRRADGASLGCATEVPCAVHRRGIFEVAQGQAGKACCHDGFPSAVPNEPFGRFDYT